MNERTLFTLHHRPTGSTVYDVNYITAGSVLAGWSRGAPVHIQLASRELQETLHEPRRSERSRILEERAGVEIDWSYYPR